MTCHYPTTSRWTHGTRLSQTGLRSSLQSFRRGGSYFWSVSSRPVNAAGPRQGTAPRSSESRKGLSSMGLPSSQLWKLERERLVTFVRRLRVRAELQEDLVGELLLREMETDQPETRTSVKNHYIDYLRGKGRREKRERIVSEIRGEYQEPGTQEDRHERASEILQELLLESDRFSPRDRYLIFRRFYGGRSIEALAREDQVSRDAVRAQLHSILALLKVLALERGLHP